MRAFAVACALASALAAPAALAQDYPTRPVRIVVGFPAGAAGDLAARTVGTKLGQALGQQVIVENKPGANNQLAAEYVAKSPNDGTVLFIGPEVTFTVNPSLYPKLAYDPIKDFSPITGLVIINHALILNPQMPAKNVGELVALAKQKPGDLNYGSFGIGSSGHLNMEMFQTLSGAKLTHVPYKGATPALTDVMAGHIQLMFISVGSAVPQWKSDKVKFIAVGAGKRMKLLPDMPTVAESGLPGYEAQSWFGLFGPAGMPADVVAKINTEVKRVFATPDFQKNFLERQYFESIAGSPEELANKIRDEEPRWRKVIVDAKVKAVD